MTQPRVIAFRGPDEQRAISRHELVRYLAGELDDERRATIAEALSSDEHLAAEAAELENEQRAFRAQMPFERFAARMEEKQPQSFFDRLRAFRFQIGGFALAAGAAAAVMLFPAPQPSAPDGVPPGAGTVSAVRLKGQGHIGLFVRDGGKARLGTDGETLHPGDQIQFVVRDEADMDAMVLIGVDGQGVVTVYDTRDLGRTTDKGGMTLGTAAKPRVLEQSVILDDALGPERFFAVYSKADPAKLKRKVARAARLLAESQADLTTTEKLDLGDLEVRQSSILIVKAPPSSGGAAP